MCLIQTSLAPSTMPRPSAGPRACAKTDGLLRELAYVYRLTERVREEVQAGGPMRKTQGIR